MVNLTRQIALYLYFSIVFVVLSTSIILFFSDLRSFDAITLAPSTFVVEPKVRNIGIIGDSWVENGVLASRLSKKLVERGHPVNVLSSGQSGANSRKIYRNTLLDSKKKYSSLFILENSNVKYCIVIAGINDTAVHMGADFYAHHTVAIIKRLLSYGITPIVLQIPNYGIKELPSIGILSSIKRILFRYCFDGGEVDVINDYQSELLSLLKLESITGFHLVNTLTYIPGYLDSSELYEDSAHLNEGGYEALAELFSQILLRENNFPSGSKSVNDL